MTTTPEVITQAEIDKCSDDYYNFRFENFCNDRLVCFDRNTGEFRYDLYALDQSNIRERTVFISNFLSQFKKYYKEPSLKCKKLFPEKYDFIEKVRKTVESQPELVTSVKRRFYKFYDYCVDGDYGALKVIGTAYYCDSYMYHYEWTFDHHFPVEILIEETQRNYLSDLYFLKGLEKTATLSIRGEKTQYPDTDLSYQRQLSFKELENFVILSKLEVSHRNIDLSTLPVLKNLKDLIIPHTNTKNINVLSDLENLESLDISYNKIRSLVPLKSLYNIKTVVIDEDSKKYIEECPTDARSKSLADFCKKLNL